MVCCCPVRFCMTFWVVFWSLWRVALSGYSNLKVVQIPDRHLRRQSSFCASYSTLPAHISFLCHSERQRRIWRTHLCTLSYHRSFTPLAASFRMTGHHSFYLHILPFLDICASNLHSTPHIQLSLRMSRSFTRHLRRQSSFYTSYSTLSAHISVFRLTYAQATINICFGWHSVCTHLPEGERGHAEYEHYFLVFYCMSVCYGLLLFVLRFLREGPRTSLVYNALILITI